MLNTMIETLKKASDIMLQAQNIDEYTDKKGDRNFVTIYDKKVQSYIKETLSKKYSNIKFMGEEEDYNDINPYSDTCFICDPIDGTANFRRTYKHSAISLALCEMGEITIGVVIQPYLNEIFYAEKRKGAYLNGNKIHVSDNELKNSFVAFGTSPYYPDLLKKTGDVISKILVDCEDIRRTGSAALDLCYTACGRHDLFFEYSLFPWDYAAGSLIITEAGGIITDFNKERLPLDKRTTVIAGNKNVYKEFFSKNYFI